MLEGYLRLASLDSLKLMLFDDLSLDVVGLVVIHQSLCTFTLAVETLVKHRHGRHRTRR